MAKYLNTELKFKDRTQAGQMLAEKLVSYELEDPIVIALPRGGVAVAKPIAKKLGVKIDIMVSKKIGAPSNPELAIGAVTSHGDYVVSSYSDYELGEKKWDFLQKQIVYLINDCREKEKKYTGRDAPTERLYNGKDIILVDDGIATGMTALAAIKSVKKQDPGYVVLAIPVISTQAYDEIIEQIDEIETIKIPKEFLAVGLHYEDFIAVDDEEITAMLA